MHADHHPASAPLAEACATPPALPALPAVDTRVRFVKLIEERADGLVAFEFAIGWPELAVELLLPAPAFAEFCAANRVQRLDA